MESSTRLLTVQNAAKYLADIGAPVGLTFIRRLIVSGEVPHIKMGKRHFVTVAALENWLRVHEKRAR